MSRGSAAVRRAAAVVLACCAVGALAADPEVTDRGAAPRTSLLPLVQPLWSDLTPAQQAVLAPFGSQWNSLPLSEKRAWAALATTFPRMGADEQKRVQRRIVQWAALTPEQRRLARANYRLAKEMPKEERVAEWEGYQSLTPEQRQVLNSAGSTSNTAARHAGAPTGLAKHAQQPLPRRNTGKPAPALAGKPRATPGVVPTVGKSAAPAKAGSGQPAGARGAVTGPVGTPTTAPSPSTVDPQVTAGDPDE